ncbi:MAG TPA: FtsX-like permease family protein [Steroidobacteraceae bacterium]|nr:FtsX-like permease family protein [Steroidobacteraceae bacterium]
MLRNMLAAALRHLARGKLYATIAVSGLAVGLCCALLAALYIRSEYSYDHFVPGYQNVYLTTLTINISGRPSFHIPDTPAQMAGFMKEKFPQITSVTRMVLERGDVQTRAGNVERMLPLYSVDPSFFATLPLKVIAGDAASVAQPERLMMTREDARTFFGDANPLGRTLTILLSDGTRHTVTVGALLEEIPQNRTQLQARLFISGVTAWTHLAKLDRRLIPIRGLSSEVRTYLRLRAGASPLSMHADMQKIIPALAERVKPPGEKDSEPDDEAPKADLVRIDHVHLNADMNPGFSNRIMMAAVLGLVVLTIAVVNFVNLLTARSGLRSLEVGIRKLAGARRSVLVLQFLGEAFIHVAIAVLLAAAMTELLLPHVNSFLEADARFEYWKEPALLGWIALGAATLSILAGSWPALVLSSLRPVSSIHGARLSRNRGGLLRQVLVSVQFALLIGLVIAAGVVYLQRHYATQAALRFDTDQMLILDRRCTLALLTELRKLPGVRDAGCSDQTLIGDGWGATTGKTREGQTITINISWIDDRVLGLYGIKPLAGRMLTASDFDASTGRGSTRYLINESAMRRLGFKSPAAALGPYPLNNLQEIIGVLPDFSMGFVDMRIQPTMFYADVGNFSRTNVKLKGTDVSPTLAAIDRVWHETGGTGVLKRYFYDEHVQRMYEGMLREGHAFGIVSVVAVLLACLGLLGLAASVAEQRTKEIGIRKAMGANTSDVLRLLLWQFSKPVLWANLLAWPVAGWAMTRWLDHFVYHVDLPLWLFPTAALAALLIAIATVSAHSLQVARAKPVAALRHE